MHMHIQVGYNNMHTHILIINSSMSACKKDFFFYKRQVKLKFLSSSAISDRLIVDNSSCHVMTDLSKHNINQKLVKKLQFRGVLWMK